MTTKAQKYALGRSQGKTKKQAALEAGYSKSTAENAKQKIENTQKFIDFNSELRNTFFAEVSPELIVRGMKELLEKRDSKFIRGREVIGTQPDTKAVSSALNFFFRLLEIDTPSPRKKEQPKPVDWDNVQAMSRAELRKTLNDLLKN